MPDLIRHPGVNSNNFLLTALFNREFKNKFMNSLESPQENKPVGDWDVAKENIIRELIEKSTGDFRFYKDPEMREKFREDIEMMCRHALSMSADVMLFCDRSARGYGLLAHKILPIIRLEYSRIHNIPLDEIKIPEVKFFNSQKRDDFGFVPPRLGYEATTDERDTYKKAKQMKAEAQEEYFNELNSILGKFIEGKKVLLCDESTNVQNLTQADTKDPVEQYDLYSGQEFNDIMKITIEGPDRYPSSAANMAHELQKRYPDSQIQIHIGEHHRQNGYDQVAKMEARELLWNTEETRPETIKLGNVPQVFKGYKFDPITSQNIPTDNIIRTELNMKKGVKPFVKRKGTGDSDNQIKEIGSKDVHEVEQQFRIAFDNKVRDQIKEIGSVHDARQQFRTELNKIAIESAENLLK